MKSSESAARFLALRAPKIVRRVPKSEHLRRAAERALKVEASKERSQAKRRIRDIAGRSIPAPWGWVEKRLPGAMAAWDRDVGLPIEEFALGTTGRPERGKTNDVRCVGVHVNDCQCREFVDGEWRLWRLATRPVPHDLRQPADSPCMTAKQQAAVIAESLLAALRIASERGTLTSENLADIATAAANNAAMCLQVQED